MEGGARDIRGGLSQKVRLIKSREVTREPQLPHTPSSNALTHAGVDKKKRVEWPLSSAWKDNSYQIKLVSIGLSPGGEGRIENCCQFLIIHVNQKQGW